MPKKISVNLSTFVDLKAELFRKQEQANRQKQEKKNDNQTSSKDLYVKGGKPILYEARKAASAKEKLLRKGGIESIEKRRQFEDAEAEEERQLSKSKQRLEEKAALYEKLQNGRDQGNADTDESGHYLVNFQRKAHEGRSPSDEETDSDDEISLKNRRKDLDDEDWVEYTDVLGRTRKCLRQDLPDFIAADEKLKDRQKIGHHEMPSTSSKTPISIDDKSELLSEDMKRDLKRKAWEREEEEAAAMPKRPVHYQHLAEGETRELGVGYYAFSADEKTRQEQMQLLEDLRQQTMSQRVRSQKLKEKRQTALKARLDKVKERKNLKRDGDASDHLSGSDDEDPISNLDIPLPPEMSSVSSLKRKSLPSNEVPSTAQKQRPWDIGKPRVPREEQWTESRRQERANEFAPPTFY